LAKIRLDLLLYQRQLADSREKAKAMILAGEITVNGTTIDKPGTNVEENACISVHSSIPKYVSRGGFKLEKAIEKFGINFNACIVLDVGASTGGYTDCALQHGAAKVYALDVGYGQLHWSLRNDSRVVNLERTNIRHFKPEQLTELVDIVTIDVSFISTFHVFPVIKHMLAGDGDIISLIKPQFEAGKDKVGKKGVVRDPAVHYQVLKDCIDYADHENLACINVTYSPIKGPQGNIEYLIHLKKTGESIFNIEEFIASVVEEAYSRLGG